MKIFNPNERQERKVTFVEKALWEGALSLRSELGNI